MPRGRPIYDTWERPLSCANCRLLRFLRYRERRSDGKTGRWFCRLLYGETGDFERQPWDWTCEDFAARGKDAVPAVDPPKGWKDEREPVQQPA